MDPDDTGYDSDNPLPSGRDLAHFAGHRIAIKLKQGSEWRVVTGVASFGYEKLLGNVLRIRLDDELEGAPVIVLGEQEWLGQIVTEPNHGCEYSLVLDSG